MSKTQSQTEIVATDITGMRRASLSVVPTLVWGAVTAQAADRLELPTRQTDDQPIIYHAFDDDSGELLPAETRVADVIERYRGELQVEMRQLRITIAPELEAA